jgi:Domain of unknown function (DUF4861)
MTLRRIILSLLFLSTAGTGMFAQPRGAENLIVECINPLPVARTDALVSIPLKNFRTEPVAFRDGTTVVPHQIVGDRIVLVLSLGPREKKRLTVEGSGPRSAAAKRTQADLAVKVEYVLDNGTYSGGRFQRVQSARTPPGHRAHDAYFKYEGPGWESELVGYRLYLDERNRCDIFGKREKGLFLHGVGVNDLVSDGKESYQYRQDWGQDIFKVGGSLGIGSFALWRNGHPVPVEVIDSALCRITQDGPLLSEITLEYRGWKVAGISRDLEARLSIAAGSRLTHVFLTSRGAPADFCTGLAKHDGCVLMTSPPAARSGWGYAALYGQQALTGDNLGTALFYRLADCVRQTEDSLSQIVVLRPRNGIVQYYFAAAWEQEPGGIRDAAAFQAYLDDTVRDLRMPVRVVVRKAVPANESSRTSPIGGHQ